jgi:Dolichyl-phosphate-mannose-protein mannosyltransferase
MTEPATLTDALPAKSAGIHRPVGVPRVTFDRILAATAAATCIGLLAYKFALTRLLNVNWDEFFFLSNVHALARGELTVLMQGAYTHLFFWLPLLRGDEMQEIVIARVLMTALLVLTAWLVWRLARLWLQGFAALVPPFAYLSMMPVLVHGGSFRSDSMLAPFSVAALLLLLAPGRSDRRDWLAGILLGVAFVITVKVVLFAPLILATLLLRRPADAGVRSFAWPEAAARSMLRVALAAGMVAVLLLGLHWLSLTPSSSATVSDFATAAAKKTLIETPWFPRLDYLAEYLRRQPYPWLMIGVGAVIALARRRFVIAALGLSLLPLAFYRNAFPYYYVVMLAPASVLAGYAVLEIAAAVRLHANPIITSLCSAVLWLGFLFYGLRYADYLAYDDQQFQRSIIAGTHEIFPEPVNYIDRCGMVSSFRKVNFFMSTWGMEGYWARNEPFLPRTLREHRPAFVLLNVWALDPNNTELRGLLPRDRELLAKYYVDYWGPIRVAGARGTIDSSSPVTLTVPFAADYRLVTAESVLIDGQLRNAGDVIPVPEEGVMISGMPGSKSEALTVTLVLASARPPPSVDLTPSPIFRGL